MTTKSAFPQHFALVVVQLCFGLFPYFAKEAFTGFEPAAVAVWRIATGGIVLLGIAFLVHGRTAIPRRADLGRLVACSMLGIAINQICFLEGQSRAQTQNTGLVIGLIPAMTYGVAVLVGAEVWQGRRGLGIFVGLLGILWFGASDPDSRLGNTLLITNCFCFSVYLVISRPLLQRYPPIVVIGWVFALSAWSVPMLALRADLAPPDASASAWWALAFILVFATCLGYLLNFFAMVRLPASTAALYTFAQPTIVGLTAFFVRNEPFGTPAIVAAVCVFAGMALVLRPDKKPEKNA